MKIAKGAVVAVDYSLHLGDGKVVDASSPGDPLTYLHGEGQIVPGLEQALEGLAVGDSRQVQVPPELGYGPSDPEGLQEVPRSAFPPGVRLEVGMELMAQGPDGDPVPFVVRDIKLETVVVDMNHPLAGRTLHFDVKVLEIRAATPEELEHGHAHGGDGHHHH